MSGLLFTPVVGTDARIRSEGNGVCGHVYFATDSKKIYYSDGQSMMSMGGNTGIYYGNMRPEKEPDSNQTSFDFKLQEIDGNAIDASGNYKKPNIEDLILNIPDGCFYRVTGVVGSSFTDTIIKTTKLTIAGSGGGGNVSGGGISSFIFSDPENNNYIRYFEKDTSKEVKLSVNVNSTITENNGIAKIEYKVGSLTPNAVVDSTWRPFGQFSLDISQYLPRMSSSMATTVEIVFFDQLGSRQTVYFYVHAVEIDLKSIYKDVIITTKNQIFQYECTPLGGNSLYSKEIRVKFKDDQGSVIGSLPPVPVGVVGSPVPMDITVPATGVYTMEIVYCGKTMPGDKGLLISSDPIVYQVVYYGEQPQLVVNVPSLRIEQYSSLDITYMIAANTTEVQDAQVLLIRNDGKQEIETPATVPYNTMQSWPLYFDTVGNYTITIDAGEYGYRSFGISVYAYEGSLPTIYQPGLTLNYSATNRNNAEVNRASWESNGYGFEFDNFAWGDTDGWLQDEDGIDILRLKSGASITLPNFDFFDKNAMESGQTIELDFKLSGVTDFTKPLIHCLSRDANGTIQAGFNITGQDSTFNTLLVQATGGQLKEDNAQNQAYNTQLQGMTARFIENERIHLTWTIDNKRNDYPMIRTYLNGKVSGITQYDKTEDSLQDNPADKARLIIDSTHGIIDIYNIRVYKSTTITSNNVIDNYIATYGTTAQKTAKYEDNNAVFDSSYNTISVLNIEEAHAGSGFKLPMPYIKIIGGKELFRPEGSSNYYDTDNAVCELPTGKKDYRSVKSYEFIDQNGTHQNQSVISNFKEDGTLNGLVMYGQGTSSMEYPVKNLRIKSKHKVDGKKTLFSVYDHDVDLICLKADYMESSGSHNTGTGNLVYNLLTGMRLKTPAQDYYSDDNIVTAIRGFPVLVFYKGEDAAENDPFEFIGKYNYNLDKATQEPFGFYHDEKATFGWDPTQKIEVDLVEEESYTDYPFDLYVKNDANEYVEVDRDTEKWSKNKTYYSIKNFIHCYEFLNNGNSLVKFQADAGKTFEETFYKEVDSDGKTVPNWFTAYESRYPEFADHQSTDIGSWFTVCNWVASTKGNPEKFAREFEEHFDLDFTTFYYVLSHVLLMIDSRAKNMMMATWDDRIWFPIFYDMDTMLGLNNYGYNKYHYDVEDTDTGVYNSQGSVFWDNFRVAFAPQIQSCYQSMQNVGLTYADLLNNYNYKQADAANESIYNVDSQYKYIRPFSERYYGLNPDTGEMQWFEAGEKDYLYASQGDRSMHRKWWLKNRINYFNGKYLSNEYKNDKYVMRIYTPSKGMVYYIPQYDLTAAEFDENKATIQYFVRKKKGSNVYWNEDGGVEGVDFEYVNAESEFINDVLYYVKQSNSARLDKSIEAVRPKNDFTLTPLYNQYLSIAFGGDNGADTTPTKVKANEAKLIPAPSGSSYNDTETYVYGGSTLKDLGDLSAQYLGQFHFPENITKLEKLTLGNFHNDYYNPNFASLQIGKKAPYLKELNIVNCSGLKGRSLNISECQGLQRVYATGSGLSNIALPAHGILEEARLPDTIRKLTIIDQPNLTNENFIIGTCDYNPNTEKKTYTNKYGGSIIELNIEDTNIDTYNIVKKNPLQRFRLININWNITDAQDLESINGKTHIKVLDKLLQLNPLDSSLKIEQSLTGTIIIKSGLVASVEEALDIYDRYCIAHGADPYFPNIDIIFEGLDICEVQILNGNDRVYWRKKIKKGSKITTEFLSNGPNGQFSVPSMNPTPGSWFVFENKWSIDGTSIVFNGRDTGVEGDEYYGWPLYSGNITSDIVLRPSFKQQVRKYATKFLNKENGVSYEITADYGTPINNLINAIPDEIRMQLTYKDDSKLAYNRVYGFLGYNSDEESANDGIALDFSQDNKVASALTYYSVFSEMDARDNVREDDWNSEAFSYIDPVDTTFDIKKGCRVWPKRALSGKITIPKEHKGLPVCAIKGEAFKDNSNITHVFVQGDNLREIQKDAFACKDPGISTLQYMDFPSKLRIIRESAFRLCDKIAPINKQINFGNNIYSIEYLAFNQAFNISSECTFSIPASLTLLGVSAFSNFRNTPTAEGSIHFIFGSSNSKSQLDLHATPNGASLAGGNYTRIRLSSSKEVILVEVHSNRYGNDGTASTYFDLTAKEALGDSMSGVKVIFVN